MVGREGKRRTDYVILGSRSSPSWTWLSCLSSWLLPSHLSPGPVCPLFSCRQSSLMVVNGCWASGVASGFGGKVLEEQGQALCRGAVPTSPVTEPALCIPPCSHRVPCAHTWPGSLHSGLWPADGAAPIFFQVFISLWVWVLQCLLPLCFWAAGDLGPQTLGRQISPPSQGSEAAHASPD